MSPKVSQVKNPNSEFIYFKSDQNKPIMMIEQTHLLSISQSDFLYVVNPGGYIGTSTLFEIGYAIALNKRVYCSDIPSDIMLKHLLIPIRDVHKILDLLDKKNPKDDLLKSKTLSEFQKYMRKKVIERGFEEETERDTLLLMLEEMGELSRIIRMYSGLKVKKEKLVKENILKIKDEFADVFIYLLILANKFEIDLESAFKSKEIKNEQRAWEIYDPLIKKKALKTKEII